VRLSLKVLFHTVELVGSLPVYVIFAFLLFAYNSSWLFVPFTLMVIISTAIIWGVRLIHPIARPGKKKPQSWKKLYQSSFPSGHTTLASGLLVVAVAKMGIFMILFSAVFLTLIIYSRMQLKRHRRKDLIAGALLGLVVGIVSLLLSPTISTHIHTILS